MGVLIVGAGPTGLALAIELARRQVPYRLIDRLSRRAPHSRALAVQARTLELMRPWGVSEPLVARGRHVTELALFVERTAAATVSFADLDLDDTPYPFLTLISQEDTEAELDAALARFGGRAELGVELESAREDDHGVAVTLRHADGQKEAARADWVVGCDGAHSAVRREANLSFAGAQYQQEFLLADAEVQWPAPHERVHALLGNGVNVFVFPLRPPVSRIIVALGHGTPGKQEPPTLEEVAAQLLRVCPWPATLVDARWLARFGLHHRLVQRYRAGRFLVAGDAAHIHSPAGGQGMNTGIQDAINLGWKLALVERGRAPAALLDSYDEERRPIGKQLLRFTDRTFSVVTSPNPALVWLRDRLAPVAIHRLMATPARRRGAFRMIGELSIHYRHSSLCGGTGERAPDVRLDGSGVHGIAGALLPGGHGGAHLIDRFAAPCHHLLAFGSAEAAGFARAAAARYAPWLDASAIDDRAARARYQVPGDGWVLVRPDGYLARRERGFTDDALADYFGSTIGISSSKWST